MIEETTTLAELRRLPLGEVIQALRPDFKPASCNREGPFGNVFFRPMVFAKAGDVHHGHCHHYDHVTFVYSGAVEVHAFDVDMATQKPKGEPINRQFLAPAMLLIKKNWMHRITALADDTAATCIYALRDASGDVVGHWDGSMEAYT